MLKIIKINQKKLEKIYKDKQEFKDDVYCARLEKISELPYGETLFGKTQPWKLICGKLIKQEWVWIGFKPDLHQQILASLFLKKTKQIFNKYIYFQILEKEPHPLEIAKSYFCKVQDYEMAHQMREYMKDEKKQKKDPDLVYACTQIGGDRFEIRRDDGTRRKKRSK